MRDARSWAHYIDEAIRLFGDKTDVVFAYPRNKAARLLQADALEQLGYRAESGPWRNFYLSGAKELRDGVMDLPAPKSLSPDVIKALEVDWLLELMAVRLNGPKAAGKSVVMNIDFTDTQEKYLLEMENGVLNYTADKQAKKADATLILTRSALNEVLMGESTLDRKMGSGEVKVVGSNKIEEFVSLLDDFDFWFNIVTP